MPSESKLINNYGNRCRNASHPLVGGARRHDSLAHLASEDTLPEDARNDRFTFSFEAGLSKDFGLSYSHDA
jgi:hypothetical protein